MQDARTPDITLHGEFLIAMSGCDARGGAERHRCGGSGTAVLIELGQRLRVGDGSPALVIDSRRRSRDFTVDEHVA